MPSARRRVGVRLPDVVAGADAASDLSALPADPSAAPGGCVVLNGINGSIGLRPTLAALAAGHTLALANKESLITGGPLVKAAAAPGQLVPVDSEHSALAQALRAGSAAEVRRLIVTASGGPFRGRTRQQLAGVTVEQALAHPTWAMGPVITINSATLVNKGLEVIEAHLLFDVDMDAIDVVVHPQSVIHSMVEFVDGALLAQASPPDMRLPIALGLSWPDRVARDGYGCDFADPTAWTFEPLDHETFPAVRLAQEAGRRGGTAPGDLQRRERGVRGRVPGWRPFVHRYRRHDRRRARRRPSGRDRHRCRVDRGSARGRGLGPGSGQTTHRGMTPARRGRSQRHDDT